MRVLFCQLNFTVGDIPGNKKKILDGLAAGKREGADLVLFPELSVTGYPPEDLVKRGGFVKSNLQALEEIARQVKAIGAIVGFIDFAEGKAFNAAALLSDGHVAGVYHKVALPNYGVFDEKRVFTPGSRVCVFDFMGVKLCPTICEDIWEKRDLSAACARLGVDVMINISASPYHRGKQREREKVARSFVSECEAALLYCNLVGGQDELVFDGGSFAVGWHREVAARLPLFEEKMELVEVDLKTKAVSGEVAAYLSEEVEIYRAIILGLRDYVRKNNFRKVLVGLSGGIDSSLVATLAVDALGKENVIGVFMPSPFTSRESQQDVEALVKNLQITCYTLPITEVFESFKKLLEPQLGRQMNIAFENLQARIRGTLLMALSNHFGYLVLSTGNKSELSTGYATLYGDMAGGFAPISDLLKEQVYQLARFCNRDREIIPEHVFTKAPTAELRPNQKDSDVLPPYDLLDNVLRAYVEENRPVAEITCTFDPALVEKVVRMVDRSEYKRRQKPPGIKVSRLAFGKDRRMPITNRFYG